MLRGIKLLFVAVLTASLSAYGQVGTGTIKGKVIDGNTGEAIPFAGVLLIQNETRKAAVQSDVEGVYKFNSVTPGTYDIKVQYVGFPEKVIKGVVVSANKLTSLDIEMLSANNLEELVIVDYTVPLIDKDGGSSGGTVTREDIAKMPGRSATSIATTVGGVYQDAGGGGNISVRGSRNDATYYFIDGIKVRGTTNLPKAAMQEVSVITGGLPANYGDATGGVISITTRGPSSYYFGGIDFLTSGFYFGGDDLGYGRKVIGLDKFAYNLVEGSLSGPLWMKKDSTGKKTTPILGFFVSANFNSQLDRRPSAISNWRIRKEVRDSLIDPALLGPLSPSGTGSFIYNTSYLRTSDLEEVAWRGNAGGKRFSLAGKIDVNTAPTISLTFGGQFDYNNYDIFSYDNALLNWENNGVATDLTWRVYGRFTQRFFNSTKPEDQNSKIKNAYYSVMVDYSKYHQDVYDPRHKENYFNYGYVGRYDITTVKTYAYPDSFSTDVKVHEEWQDSLIIFTPSDVNASLAALTNQYFQENDYVANYDQVLAGNALRNGDLPRNVYNTWRNIGYNYNGASKTDNNQFRISGSGSADIGDHAVTVGFEFEQRSDSRFSLAPVGLWTRMRLLTNSHFDNRRDLDNPIYSQSGSFLQIDYNYLNSAPGAYSGDDSQPFFDYNLRLALGLDPDGTDLLNVDAIDPGLFELDWFTADELLGSGNNALVSYYGYDHTGDKIKGRPSFDDFFLEKDEFGNFVRPVGAYEPIYISGYIMDKFAFDDLIFNIGVRIDRFDANQPVLKDPWLLAEAYTVGEVNSSEFGPHPTNMGDDYVVYVNDLYDPTGINGYRRNNGDGTSTWFNADGIEITDPAQIETSSGIAPYLVNDPDEALNSSAFKDYDPQITIMPRINFSFPISDEAVFFAHYDILSRRPSYGTDPVNRLDILDYYFLENNSVIVNNPDLKPEKTIDYEIGFQQVLSRSSSLKISAFYREQRNQVALVSITGAYPQNYRTWGNIDFGTVKGMTIAYDLRRTGNLWMRASYTLQFAEGTGSDAASALNLVNSGQPNLRSIYPYSYDQRHAITATIDYRYGEGKNYNGPVWGGKQVFKNTGINIVTNMGSGTPYSKQRNITSDGYITGSSGVLSGQINGARKPGQFRMDAQLDRNFTLQFGNDEEKKKKANLNVYLLVTNVFNTNNIVSVYPATGNPNDDGYLDAAVSQAAIAAEIDSQSFRELYSLKVNNPSNYGLPRTIRLGIRLDF